MLNFAPRALLAASLAAAVSTVVAAPTSASSDWTYWITTRDDADPSSKVWTCSAEVVHIKDTNVSWYIHRARSDEACVRSATGVDVFPMLTRNTHGEVVVFKPDAVGQSETLQPWESGWYNRFWEALQRGADGEQEGQLTATLDASESRSAGQTSFQLGKGYAKERSKTGLDVLLDAPMGYVIAVSEEELSTIDMRATWDTRVQRLSFRPTSSARSLLSAQDKKPEPIFKKPKYNSNVAKIASTSALHPDRILKDLRILTGEATQPKDIGSWHTRHSSTAGARLAGKWIKRELEQSLSSLSGASCNFWEYSPYFAPNVVCKIPSSTSGETTEGKEEEAVLISAHYDSRGTFGSTTAPGGDDDGSGTSALLGIARAIGNANLTFESPVQLVAFSGEEQGLVGSQKYAAHLAANKVPLKLAVQMDMLAYRKPGEPMQLAFPDKLATKSATAHVWALADIYAPELEQGYTPACCSDHQSFWENNYPATWVFERNGPIADPKYHNSGDTTDREGYDVGQLAAIAKVVLVTLLDVAGFEL